MSLSTAYLPRLLVHHQAHRDAGDRRLAAARRRPSSPAIRRRPTPSTTSRSTRGCPRRRGPCRGTVSSAGIIGVSERSASAPWPTSRRPGPAQERHFADRERREVVVEHEALPGLALEALDLLRIVGGAERAGDERLRLAAREHGRAVGARQHAGLDPDRPHLVELAAVEPHAVLEHLVAQDLFLQVLEDLLGFDLPLDLAFGNATRPDRRAPDRRARSFRACRGCASPRSAGRAPSLRPRGRSRGRFPSSATFSFVLPASLASVVDRRRRSA